MRLSGRGVKFILDKINFTNAPATNRGDRSAATNTGDRSAATVEGHDSVAIVTGYQSKAKGALGCILGLLERNKEMKIISGKFVKVDGKKIKPDVFYSLVKGKVTKVN